MILAKRRGACPSIDAPMRTGDGLLVRITPARGYFDPGELSAIAAAAESCGNGVIEVSTRGNLQVRGLSSDTTPAFKTHIAEAGIEISSGVPIVCSPLAGFDATEIFDASKIHCVLREEIAKSKFAAGLGPKVSVVIDGRGQLNLSQLIADVRIKAVSMNGVPRWQLLVGGTEAKSRALGLALDDTTAITAIMTLLERIASRGKTARGRDLDDDDLGAVMDLLESGAKNTHVAAKSLSPIGLFNLTAGKFAVGIGLPFGTTSAAELAKFVHAARRAGGTQIRPAPGKAFLVPGIDAQAADNLMASARENGFVSDADDPRLAIVTCAGKPACNSAHIETRILATHLAMEFRDQLVGDQSVEHQTIHISGCDKGCANPGSPNLEIIGTPDGYRLSTSARTELCANADDLSHKFARALESDETSTTTTDITTATVAERNFAT